VVGDGLEDMGKRQAEDDEGDGDVSHAPFAGLYG
jgi:hypothetical protein